MSKRKGGSEHGLEIDRYDEILADVAAILEEARHAAARSVNAVMTATYWAIGRRVVEHEQGGEDRAGYGEELLKRLSRDLGARFGRGFSLTNLKQFRKFYLVWRVPEKGQTASGQLPPPGKGQTPSDQSGGAVIPATARVAGLPIFPLSWSHYVRLMSVENEAARRFYEAEALRGGWNVRQLKRQIGTQFYERTALSRDKAAMLRKGSGAGVGDAVSAEEAVKDPYLLEFLDLRDEYSESDLEEALIRRLEEFLLELGGEFTFAGRQRRLRQHYAGQHSASQISTLEPGPSQVHAHHAGLGEIGADQVGSAQVGAIQDGVAQIGSIKVGARQIDHGQVGAVQVGAAKVGALELFLGQIAVAQVLAHTIGRATGATGAASEKQGQRQEHQAA